MGPDREDTLVACLKRFLALAVRAEKSILQSQLESNVVASRSPFLGL